MFNFKYPKLYKIDQFVKIPDPVMLDNNPKTITRYYNEVFFYAMNINGYSRLLTDLKVRAKSLIIFLKKNYELE